MAIEVGDRVQIISVGSHGSEYKPEGIVVGNKGKVISIAMGIAHYVQIDGFPKPQSFFAHELLKDEG